jgi:uncharacterized membrane protein
MAGQKQARAASGPAKNGGTAKSGTGTRAGSGNSNRGGQARQGAAGQNGGRAQGSQGQSGRGQGPGGRGQGGRGQDSPGRTGPGRPAGAQARSGVQVAEPADAKAAQQRFSAPRWLQLATLGLSLAGLGVSIYLTIVHFGSKSILVCSSNGAIDCEKVLSSSQAMVFGVFPVAVLGLAFFVFMTAINSPWAWRSPLPVIWWARLAAGVTGMGFVLYLIYAELIQIGNICLWCTSVHAITFLLFVLLIFAATLGTGSATKTAR